MKTVPVREKGRGHFDLKNSKTVWDFSTSVNIEKKTEPKWSKVVHK